MLYFPHKKYNSLQNVCHMYIFIDTGVLVDDECVWGTDLPLDAV